VADVSQYSRALITVRAGIFLKLVKAYAWVPFYQRHLGAKKNLNLSAVASFVLNSKLGLAEHKVTAGVKQTET
jgi:hypothetical protein